MAQTSGTGDDRSTRASSADGAQAVRPVTDAMIVAGGRGTRLQPLTHQTPKPLLDFCGQPFLAGVIGRLAAAGVQRVFLVVGKQTSPFEVLRPLAADHGVEVVMVPEPEPLDTAGGVRAAAEQVDDAFLVLNGDILTDLDVAEVVATHRRRGVEATLHLWPVQDTSSFGVCVFEDGLVTSFVEKPPPGTLPGHHNINAGTYVIEPEAILQFPSGRLSFERAVFPGILERGGAIAGHVGATIWADLGTPERWRDGHRQALDGLVPWPSVLSVSERDRGVRVAATATIDPRATLRSPVLVLDGAKIGPGAVVGPHVVVGQGSSIGEGVHLQDAVIGRRVRVGDGVRAGSVLLGDDTSLPDRCRIGRDVVVGDALDVPAGSELPDGSRVPSPRG